MFPDVFFKGVSCNHQDDTDLRIRGVSPGLSRIFTKQEEIQMSKNEYKVGERAIYDAR